jgi:hypothetical protein
MNVMEVVPLVMPINCPTTVLPAVMDVSTE